MKLFGNNTSRLTKESSKKLQKPKKREAKPVTFVSQPIRDIECVFRLGKVPRIEKIKKTDEQYQWIVT